MDYKGLTKIIPIKIVFQGLYRLTGLRKIFKDYQPLPWITMYYQRLTWISID